VTWDRFSELVQMLQLSEDVKEVVASLTRAAQSAFDSDVIVFPFGSAATGFSTSDSDIDLCLRVRSKLSQVGKGLSSRLLNDSSFAAALRDEGFKVKVKILHAKVPILTLEYVSQTSGVRHLIDLSINNGLPLFNTLLLMRYGQICPAVISLASEVKAWAKEHQVHSAKKKFLSSYALNLMVVFFFQARGALPNLQSTEASEYYRESDQHFVPDHFYFNVSLDLDSTASKSTAMSSTGADQYTLKDFLNFYVQEYKWSSHAISVRQAKMVPLSELTTLKVKKNASRISIEDPFDVSRNLCKPLTATTMQRFIDTIEDAAAPSDCGSW
jgi:DNA polymerase sigma